MPKIKESEMLEDLYRYKEILQDDELPDEDREFFTAGVKILEKQLKQRGWL